MSAVEALVSEQLVQDCLKKWPTPWRRYNGRIIAINGATVGCFSPKVSVANPATVDGVTLGMVNVEEFSDTIAQLVGLGEIMERAFKFSDVARMDRLEKRHGALLAQNATLRKALQDAEFDMAKVRSRMFAGCESDLTLNKAIQSARAALAT